MEDFGWYVVDNFLFVMLGVFVDEIVVNNIDCLVVVFDVCSCIMFDVLGVVVNVFDECGIDFVIVFLEVFDEIIVCC